MKNILSTLAVLALVGVSGVGAVILYQYAFEPENVFVELSPEEAASEIALRLGQPFNEAWATRDAKALVRLTRGEFGGSLPTNIEWTIESNPPFETKQRTCEEEERNSTNDFDVFFGHLLEPVSGQRNLQTEFSVLKAMYYARKNGDTYYCDVLLSATGINENGGVSVYRSTQEVIVSLPDPESSIPASFQSWQLDHELVRLSTEPVADQIYELLSKQGIASSSQPGDTLDVADFDGDNDLDIALTLSAGKRFVFAFDKAKYSDVTASLGISGDVGKADGQHSPRTTWFDFNKDGFPDLISGDQLFKNENGKKFVAVTEEVGLKSLMGGTENDLMGRLRRHFQAQ